MSDIVPTSDLLEVFIHSLGQSETPLGGEDGREAAVDRTERMRSRLLTGPFLGKPVTEGAGDPGVVFLRTNHVCELCSASPVTPGLPQPLRRQPPTPSAEWAAPLPHCQGDPVTASRALHMLWLWRKGPGLSQHHSAGTSLPTGPPVEVVLACGPHRGVSRG